MSVRLPSVPDPGRVWTLRLPFGSPEGLFIECEERGHEDIGLAGVLVRLSFMPRQAYELGLLASALFGNGRLVEADLAA